MYNKRVEFCIHLHRTDAIVSMCYFFCFFEIKEYIIYVDRILQLRIYDIGLQYTITQQIIKKALLEQYII